MSKRRKALMVVTVSVVAVIAGSALYVAANSVLEVRRTSWRACQLSQISAALMTYSDTHRRFPPAVVHGPDGRPWHSWRVAILMELGAEDLYAQYTFDEPWDSPRNRAVLDRMPNAYRDYHDSVPEGQTRIMAIVGPESIWSIGDGLYEPNTLLLASASSGEVEWTRPSDVTIEELIGRLKEQPSEVAWLANGSGSKERLTGQASIAELKSRVVVQRRSDDASK